MTGAGAVDQSPRRIQVNISHIVNPSHFYFTDDDVLDSNYQLPLKLNKYFQQNSVSSYFPKKNELVGVFNIAEKSWQRARVDQIYEFRDGKTYILWTIDYGKPMVTKPNHIQPLPIAFQNIEPNNIYFGGINNLLPAKKILDYTNRTSRLQICKNWSSESCEMFEKLNENSEERIFTITRSLNGQFFGELEFKNSLNKKFNLSNVLCKENYAMESEPNEFFDKIDYLQLNKTDRWLSASGNCKLLSYQNNYSLDIENNLPSLNKNSNSTKNQTELELQQELCSALKIKDWHERNNKLNKFNNSLDTIRSYNFNKEDEDSLSNFDSVSVQNEEDLVIENNLTHLRNMNIEIAKTSQSEDCGVAESEFGLKVKFCGNHSKIRNVPTSQESIISTNNKLLELETIEKTLNKKPNMLNQSVIKCSVEKKQLSYLQSHKNYKDDQIITDDVQSGISNFSGKSKDMMLAKRKQLLSKSDMKMESDQIINDDVQSGISNFSGTSKQMMLAKRKQLLAKSDMNMESDQMINDDVQSGISNFSGTSKQMMLAKRKQLLAKSDMNMESDQMINDDVQSGISNFSGTSKQMMLAKRKQLLAKSDMNMESDQIINNDVQSGISNFSGKSKDMMLAKRKQLLSKSDMNMESDQMINDDVQSGISNFSGTSKQMMLAKRKQLLAKSDMNMENSQIINDDTQSTISNSSRKSKDMILAIRKQLLAKFDMNLENSQIINDDAQSTISNSSRKSKDMILAIRKQLLSQSNMNMESGNVINDDVQSTINNCSNRDMMLAIKKQLLLQSDMNMERGKVINDDAQSTISNSSRKSKDIMLSKRKQLLHKFDKNIESGQIDDAQSTISNSSSKAKDIMLSKRKQLLSISDKNKESDQIINDDVESGISNFSGKSKDMMLAKRKQLLSKSDMNMESGQIINDDAQSSISNNSRKSKDNILAIRKQLLPKSTKTIQNGENENYNARYDQLIKNHNLRNETKNLDDRYKTNISKNISKSSVLQENYSRASKSCSSSSSNAPIFHQKDTKLSEKNAKINLPAGYNLPCITTFKKQNRLNDNKHSRDGREKCRLSSNEQNLINHNNKNENKHSTGPLIINKIHNKSNNNNLPNNIKLSNRNQLEEINDVCISDTSDYSKDLVLVHGNQISAPIYKLEKAEFSKIVYKGLEQFLRDSSVYRIQQCSWKHISKGSSLVLISRPKTGKTLAYLPSICSLIHMEREDQEFEFDRGPIAIIIVSSRKDAISVKDKCKYLITDKNNYNDHIALCTSVKDEKEFNTVLVELFKGKDILICTPKCLNKLFSQKVEENQKKYSYVNWFSRDRLKHIVIENYDLWNDENRKILIKYIKKFNLNNTENIQMIVTSNIWEPDLQSFIKLKTFCNPLLCIGAHIEAAFYGGTHFNLEIVSKLNKIESIRRFIQKYSEKKLIIVCSTDNEVNDINEELKKIFICVKITSQNSHDSIENLSRRWKNNNFEENEILICTDEQLNALKIKNATKLIHYSLINSWSKFCSRFSTLLHSYIDRINLNFEPINFDPPKTLILVDEYNDEQLPKLIQFLERINCKIPSNIKELSIKIDQANEKRRNFLNNNKICTKFIEFGKFHDKENCGNGRHVLNKIDESYNHIPENGIIKYEVINIFSPVHYTVRIVSYQSCLKAKPIIYNKSSMYAPFSIKFLQHFSNPENHILYSPPILHDVCVIEDDYHYYRCQIIQLFKGYALKKAYDLVECKLLDDGKTIICSAKCLLSLPEEFREFPYQATDLRLTGIIPVDAEDEWDIKLNETIKQWFKIRESCENTYFTSKVSFTILNTVFVPEIVLSEKLEENISLHRVFVKNNLLKKKLVIQDTTITEDLKKMALSLNILRDSKTTEDKEDTVKLTEDNNIIKPSNKSLNLSEENNILKDIESNLNIKNKLIPFQNNESFSSSISETPMSGLRARPIRGLRKTNINETWSTLSENKYTEVVCSAYYNPNEFYVFIDEKEYKYKRNELYNKIDSYIGNDIGTIKQPEIGINCIGKLKQAYERCKIIEIIYDPNLKDIRAKVFFVDDGSIGNCSIKNLYPSTKEIVECIPYQAIRCKLIGGVWKDNYADVIYDELLETSEHLFARPINCQENRGNLILKNSIYNVVLVDCTSSTDILINKEIIERGYGKEDPETKHFIKIPIEDDCTEHIDDEENWDNENTGLIFEYKPPKNDNNLNEFSNEEDHVFDVNLDEDDLKEWLGLPMSAKFLEPETVSNDKLESDQQKLNKQKSKINNSTENEKILIPNDEKMLIPNDGNLLIKEANVEKNQIKDELVDMPKLIQNRNLPSVTWKQSEDSIRLEILAPDIENYDLVISKNHLYFAAIIESELKQLDIQLLRCIIPEYSYYEYRGLNLIVTLVKSLRNKNFMWPRLTFANEKNCFIKYDINAIEYKLQSNDYSWKNQDTLSVIDFDRESTDEELVSNDGYDRDRIYDDMEDDHDPFADEFN